MKTKRVKIEYFLLMGIAFLFHSFVKYEFISTNKKMSNYFAYEENKSKILYGFILEFQQKVEAFGIKKAKNVNKGNSFVSVPLENMAYSDSYGNFSLVKEKNILEKSYHTNVFFEHTGVGERMFKSSYLV